MHYKTIVMELINDHPELQSRLLENQTLLPSIEQWAVILRRQHRELIEEFLQQESGVTANEVSSRAMEVAVEQIREQLLQIPAPMPTE
jgi:hypothetical protein